MGIGAKGSHAPPSECDLRRCDDAESRRVRSDTARSREFTTQAYACRPSEVDRYFNTQSLDYQPANIEAILRERRTFQLQFEIEKLQGD